MSEGRRCPSANLLVAYSDHPDDYPDVARHAAACSECTAVIAILGRIESEEATSKIDECLSELDTLMEEIRSAPRHRWPGAAAEPRFRRADLAQRFITAGLDARWKEPRLAIDLTKVATTIVSHLPEDDPEVAEVRFEAWKIHSALLRESGRYEECRIALERATEAALRVRDVEMADASILLSRALLALEPDIWSPDEARALLDVVEPIYVRRDPIRWLGARTTRGTLLYRSGDPRSVEVYREVFVRTPESDVAWHDALSNLLWARIENGDAASDIDECLAALEADDRRRNATALIARDHWLRGKLLALRVEHDTALDAFADATAKYQLLNNDDALVRVGIDAVASTVALERYEAAISMCRSLAEYSIRLDRNEPTRRRALTAQVMTYLRELAQQYALTEDVMFDVRRYIFRITYQHPFPFRPPLSPLTV